jgi:solute carrier family 25 citrate transporter 1
MVAQALASVVYTPVDVVKERLQAREALGSAGAGASYRGTADAYRTIVKNEVRSISHWSPYDPVAVVNADP